MDRAVSADPHSLACLGESEQVDDVPQGGALEALLAEGRDQLTHQG